MAPPKILAICGSLRKTSFNKLILNVAVDGAKQAGGEVEIVDLAQYDLPMYNQDLEGGQYPNLTFPESVEKFRKLILESDGLLIATPEYNFGLPAVLKNAIDWCSRPSNVFSGKVVASCGASMGPGGTVIAQENLRTSLSLLEVYYVNKSVRINKVHEITKDGNLSDETYKQRLIKLGQDLVSECARRKIVL